MKRDLIFTILTFLGGAAAWDYCSSSPRCKHSAIWRRSPSRIATSNAARDRAGCNGVIRVAAPYDLRPELDQAAALTGNAVRFEQVASGQDVTIHERRYDGKVWARGAMPGREVWMDFPRVPAEWRGRVLLHEFIHNAGFSHADGCDVMADPPQWCDGRPIVRSEYVRGLQRLARCQQERPSSIQATSAPVQIVTDYGLEVE